MAPIRPPSFSRDAQARLAGASARPAIRPAPRAGLAAGKVLRPMARRFGPSLAELTDRWPEIAGERLALLARPLRLSPGREGAVLTLLARGPAAALVQAESARIIERANLYCGAGTVARLNVRQGPLHERPAAPAASPRQGPSRAPRGLSPSETQAIQAHAEQARSPALRAALERLGRAVLSRAP